LTSVDVLRVTGAMANAVTATTLGFTATTATLNNSDAVADVVIAGTGSGTTGVVNMSLATGSQGFTITHASGTATTLVGSGNNDVITGGNVQDTISGLSGADALNGGTAAESISGGNGADIIDAGTGGDSVIGGAGADKFFHNAGDGVAPTAITDGTDAAADGDRLSVTVWTFGGTGIADVITNFEAGDDVDGSSYGAGLPTVISTQTIGDVTDTTDFVLYGTWTPTGTFTAAAAFNATTAHDALIFTADADDLAGITNTNTTILTDLTTALVAGNFT
jgi:Ca2+-binding RTX toxin-like protein